MVPKGWIYAQIDEIGEIQVGRDLKEENYSETKTEQYCYPVFSNTVENRGLYGYYNFPEYIGNSVTIVGRGIGLGTAFARPQGEGFGAIGRLLVLSPKDDSFDVVFLENYINHSLVIHNESGGIPQLPGSSLAKYKVLIPPLSEQKKIAQILSTWDQAIATIERLLDLAHQQKKALMQQLLTGKKRFPGFEGAWLVGHLSDIAKIGKGKALSSKDLLEGDYPVIAGGKTSPYSHRHFTHENAITVSASGAYAGYVSYHPYKIWASDCSVVIAKKNADTLFLFQLLTALQNKIYSLQSGGAQSHIYPKDLESLKVAIPPLEEQKKIAAVLTSADQEIETLQSQLDGLKQEKKALMQALLTGKRRVLVS